MPKFKSEFLQKAQERGFLNQCTNLAELDKKLSEGRVVAYWGTDPTGPSMHTGHLFSLMILRLFQQCGHKPIVLLGGATGLIGDPTGKDKSRPVLSKKFIEQNKQGIKKALEKFIRFDNSPTGAILVDNADWLSKLNYIEFLRDIGPHFSVNRMLTFESVKLRLQKEEHMNLLEFNYMVMQAYDFYYLHKNYGCILQLCGGDQWGNVVAGVELTRRLNFAKEKVEQGKSIEVFGLSTELLLDASGKKVGKSEGNALWIDEELSSPFDYFQYFRNIADADIDKFLRVYTELSIDEIKELEKLEGEKINDAKKILAFEATKICHGERIAQECLEKAEKIFEDNSVDDLPIIEFNKKQENNLLYAFLREKGICPSGGEARRLIKNGAIKINDEKITDEEYKIEDFLEFKLSIGKKKRFKVLVK
jgi:tyrosyl-tRNA synthetase